MKKYFWLIWRYVKRQCNILRPISPITNFNICYREMILSNKKNLFFIQIGANDGVRSDPIFAYVCSNGWRGILVEPLQEPFSKLKKNYEGAKGMIFENCAISERDGEITFYKYPQDTVSSIYSYEDFSQVPRIMEKRKREKPEMIHVKSKKFSTLLDDHDVTHADFLQIDAEGYDYEIIKQIPFERCKPTYIQYEISNLSKTTAKKSIALLKQKGYNILNLGSNVFAFRWMVYLVNF